MDTRLRKIPLSRIFIKFTKVLGKKTSTKRANRTDLFLNPASSKLWLIYQGGSENRIELLFAQSFRNLLTTYLQIIYCLELIHQSLAHEAANSYVKERKK